MLAKQHHLTKKKDFENVFNHGKSYNSRIFRVLFIANKLTDNRYGLIVSTKVSKKAVDRNRIRRRLSEAIRQMNKALITGLDLIIIARPAILNQSYKVLANELKQGFNKIKLISKE